MEKIILQGVTMDNGKVRNLNYEGVIKILNGGRCKIEHIYTERYSFYSFKAISNTVYNPNNSDVVLKNTNKILPSGVIFSSFTVDNKHASVINVAKMSEMNSKLFLCDSLMINVEGFANLRNFSTRKGSDMTIIDHRVFKFYNPNIFTVDLDFLTNSYAYSIDKDDRNKAVSGNSNVKSVTVDEVKKMNLDLQKRPYSVMLPFDQEMIAVEKPLPVPMNSFTQSTYITYSALLEIVNHIDMTPTQEIILNGYEGLQVYQVSPRVNKECSNGGTLINFITDSILELGTEIKESNLIFIPAGILRSNPTDKDGVTFEAFLIDLKLFSTIFKCNMNSRDDSSASSLTKEEILQLIKGE